MAIWRVLGGLSTLVILAHVSTSMAQLGIESLDSKCGKLSTSSKLVHAHALPYSLVQYLELLVTL